MTNTQLGYSLITTTNTTITTSSKNLASVTIPAGVWIVEGAFEGSLTGVNFYTISLSKVSFVQDGTRTNVNYVNSVNTTWSNHITSVFVLTASTNIYFVGILTGGTAASCINTLTYTKIG